MDHGNDDRCTRGTGRSKTAAGITVYLLEELGDARLRCAQLKKLVSDATTLVEKSEKRDHFFEVAGHLIHGIPDTLFRLEKALDAAAMSASRMDYEEIKQNLKPEKAEEMEQVLNDARLRYLTRRSNQLAGPKAAIAEVERIANISEQTGQVPVSDLLVLAAALENGVRTASDEAPTTAAEQLRSIARTAADEKSKVALAQAIRGFLAASLQPTMEQTVRGFLQAATSREEVIAAMGEADPTLTDSQLARFASEWEESKASGEVLSRFEEGKPADPTESMSTEDAAEWERMNEEHGDNFKTAKLQARQEAILKEYLKSGGTAMLYDDLPPNVWAAIRRVKDQETLPSDVDRWLSDHNNPHTRSMWAASSKTAFIPNAYTADTLNLYIESMKDRLLVAKRTLQTQDWRHFKFNLRHLVNDFADILNVIGLTSAVDRMNMVQRELVTLPLGQHGGEAPTPMHMASAAQEAWEKDAYLVEGKSREHVMEQFKKRNPSLTDEHLEAIADHWEKNKDNFKAAGLDPVTGKWSAFAPRRS